MTGVSGRVYECRRGRRAHLHGMRVRGGMTVGAMGHMDAGHARHRRGEPNTPHADKNARPE
jgi:hypothetical protein